MLKQEVPTPKILMKYQLKFKEPINKEEKLIHELSHILHDCVQAYIRLNRATCSDIEMFLTTRDGALAFVGQTLHALMNIMINDNAMKLAFLKESQDIFNCYIEQTSESIKQSSSGLPK